MKTINWITRNRPKLDRVVYPRLIKRQVFVVSQPAFRLKDESNSDRHEIELNDPSDESNRICLMENLIRSRSRRGHLSTRSALASTFGDTSMPICLAAFKLITSSNFIGCSIGKSAGFLPLRILSTYVAARR
jgi:hypothetical protein